jgi:hypothetical protein
MKRSTINIFIFWGNSWMHQAIKCFCKYTDIHTIQQTGYFSALKHQAEPASFRSFLLPYRKAGTNNKWKCIYVCKNILFRENKKAGLSV